MPARNESAHAQARLDAETPIDDADLLKLQEQAAEFIREAKRRDTSAPNAQVSSLFDAVARNYFRYAIQKKRAPRRPA